MIQALANALTERGYDKLTAVQEAVTNPDLQEADLLVSAQTGSGKTVGFGLAIAPTLLGDAETLGRAGSPLALIVAPTRELAFQVMRELSWLYKEAGARVATCIGGMDARDERRSLERGAHIVVGTPGRLVDHIQRGALDLSDIRAIVLDEADEMLDLGFREDLEFMLAKAPEGRRTLLFSATVPPMIAKLAEQFQRDAVRVTTLNDSKQHADITYQALQVAQQDAENAIINVLRFHDAENAIIFANTRAMVARLSARLTNRGFSVVTLSGELSQNERSHALQAMRDGRARVCVATDVAARGIDLPKLELVVHAELPSNSETLLHRSGRTGRAGRKGVSALIVPPRSTKKAERLLKFAKIKAEWTAAPSADEILRKDEERLLNDPVWDTEPTEDQAAFAARLLEMHGPEKLATAFMALHRARLSAPEDLSPPNARPEREERKPFGPSVWVALSVGRNDRAEPRWLLPLLCRAGNLNKDDIGAIRVQDKESFVQIAETALDGFMGTIGADMALEDGVTVRQLDPSEDISALTRKPSGPPRRDFDRRDGDRREGGYRGKPRDHDGYTGARQRGPKPDGPKPYKSKPRDKMAEAVADGSVTSYRGDKGGKPASKGKPPYKAKSFDASDDKPRNKPAGKFDDKPRGKPAGKFGDKPRGKPAGKFDDKPRGKPGGKPTGKPGGKFGPKSGPKSGAPKPARDKKPAGPKASDTSKRFNPKGKPAKPRKGFGGGEPPRRG